MRAAETASSSSSGSRTRRIPLPPPPAEAFTSRGSPTAAPAAVMSASLASDSSSAPGTRGTPAAATSRLASTLSAMAFIDSGVGPIQASPASATARANSGFSDRKP